jgi:hypothetical protein
MSDGLQLNGDLKMNTLNSTWTTASPRDLERVIEPLASYISATNQPMATLASALAALVSEVKKTNRTASTYVAACREHC